MKCDICHEKEAVVFIRQVSGNAVSELHMCQDCAKVRGFSADESKIEMSLGSLLSGLVDTTLQQNTKNRACTVCGSILKDILDSRKAGCPECYTHFKNEILSQMRSDGINGSYSGTLPKQLAYFKSSLTDRMMLQAKLEKALSEENYEQAAVYRDRLRVLDKRGVLSADHEQTGGLTDE